MPNQGEKKNGLAWVGIAVAVLGAGAFWALVPTGDDGRAGAGSAPAPATEAPSRAAKLGAAIELLRQGQPGGEAAPVIPQPTAQDLLDTLFTGEDAAAHLGLVLAAVEANPTPPEQDPLWPRVVDGISSLWTTETLTWGLDLMVSERRPRARQAVLSSFSKFVTMTASSERARRITPEQVQTLTNHFIDAFPQLTPAQKVEATSALRAVGATDAAEVLQGRGLDSNEALAIHRERNQALQEGERRARAEENARPIGTAESPPAP